jgi:hypothetical protein
LRYLTFFGINMTLYSCLTLSFESGRRTGSRTFRCHGH